VTKIGLHHGHPGTQWMGMGAFNCGQRPGLRRRGRPACVEMRARNATEGRGESRSSTRHRVQETRGPLSYAARRSADIAGSRHI